MDQNASPRTPGPRAPNLKAQEEKSKRNVSFSPVTRRYDPGFFDGSEKRLQTQRAEALHKLIDAGHHEAVLTTVVDEASRCFSEGGGGVGYFKRLSKVIVDASKVPAALEWLQVSCRQDRGENRASSSTQK